MIVSGNNKILKLLPFAIALALIVLSISCKKHPVEPKNTEIPDTSSPGRRDYVWTADTLPKDVYSLFSLWGSSHNDVWAVGYGSSFDLGIWHYDGVT